MSVEQDILIGLRRRGVPEDAAKGIVANMVVESGLDPGINEISPVVEGSRGGFGLAQWTGPRRRALESFARQQGRDPADVGVQLDFLMRELETTERGVRDDLFSAGSPREAATIFSNRFERPGTPNLDRRIQEANRLAGVDIGGGGQERQPNVLDAAATGTGGQQAPNVRINALDPAAFLSRRRFG